MSDGTLSVRRRDTKVNDVSQLGQGQANVPGFLSGIHDQKKGAQDAGELRLQSQTSKRLKDYDKLLKNFKYSAALDAVLKKVRVVFHGVVFSDLMLVRMSLPQLRSLCCRSSYIEMDLE